MTAMTFTTIEQLRAGQTAKTDRSTFEVLSHPWRRGAYVRLRVRDLNTGVRAAAIFRSTTPAVVVPD